MEQTTIDAPLRVGVAGFGYWGPNHVRNVDALAGQGVEMKTIADPDPTRRVRARTMFPGCETVASIDELLVSDVDAVVVATPVHTHFAIVKAALEAGKHVLVEKPITTSVDKSVHLTGLAAERDLVLMVGHTFEYAPAVRFMRDTVESGELGDVLYIRSQRVNLGQHRKHVNVLWDLAPHDISIILELLGRMPNSASAMGRAHIDPNIDDIVNLNLEFEDRIMSNIVLSWLDPKKVREMTVIGSEKMMVYDDTSNTEKIRLYDKGAAVPPEYRSFGEFQVSYRNGDIISPKIDNYEPLAVQTEHFVECIRTGKTPLSDGESGTRVVRVLSAAQLSLNRGGVPVSMDDPEIDALDGTLSDRTQKVRSGA